MDSNFRIFNNKAATAVNPQHDIAAYAAILLREFNNLVRIMLLLDETIIEHFNDEINLISDKMAGWFDESSAANTLKLYWEIRHLVRVLSHAGKPAKNNPTMEKPFVSKKLVSQVG